MLPLLLLEGRHQLVVRTRSPPPDPGPSWRRARVDIVISRMATQILCGHGHDHGHGHGRRRRRRRARGGKGRPPQDGAAARATSREAPARGQPECAPAPASASASAPHSSSSSDSAPPPLAGPLSGTGVRARARAGEECGSGRMCRGHGGSMPPSRAVPGDGWPASFDRLGRVVSVGLWDCGVVELWLVVRVLRNITLMCDKRLLR